MQLLAPSNNNKKNDSTKKRKTCESLLNVYQKKA